MIDIGIVGLDTSHPESFANCFEALEDVTVSAVWDGGAVRDESDVTEFCDSHDAVRCEDLDSMASRVDAAMVLTVNWDTHVEYARPFLEADIPTFVDKPIAGRLSDVESLAGAAESTPLFGGSSIPYHPAVADVPVSSGGRTLYCVGYNDPFYYGAHAVHTTRHLAGADWHTVSPGSGPGTTVDVLFENDTHATVQLDGSPPYQNGGFVFTSVGETTDSVLVEGDSDNRDRMYRSFVERFVRIVRGESHDHRPMLDGARLLLATHAALEGGRPVTPESQALRDYHADGAAFTEEYRRNR